MCCEKGKPKRSISLTNSLLNAGPFFAKKIKKKRKNLTHHLPYKSSVFLIKINTKKLLLHTSPPPANNSSFCPLLFFLTHSGIKKWQPVYQFLVKELTPSFGTQYIWGKEITTKRMVKKNYKKIKRIIPCDYSVSIFLSFLPSFCIWSSDTPVLEVLKKEGTWSITVLILSKPRSPRLAYWMAFSCICYY